MTETNRSDFHSHKIVLEDSAKAYLEEKGIKEITVDLASFGACIAVSEAVVTEGPPTDRPTTFLRYDVDGYVVHVYSLAKFVRDTVTIFKKKGILSRPGLEAKQIYQL